MSKTMREGVLLRLRRSRAEGRALLAVGAAFGLVAGAAEDGGADLIVVYNSGRFRRAGHSSLCGLLPLGDANALVAELLPEILAAVRDVPVVVGVCATDPFCDLEHLLRGLRDLGVAGVQNFPTIGLYGSELRLDLARTGIDFEREVELVRVARRLGLLTCAFVTEGVDAERMALAGADVIAPHLGVTSSEGHGAEAHQDSARRITELAAAAHNVRDDLLTLFHGGPAATPAEVEAILTHADGVDGYFAASAVERLPVQRAVKEATVALSSIPLAAVPPGDALMDIPDFQAAAPLLPLDLTTETLPAYLREKGVVAADAPIHAEELGGGLSNVVLYWSVPGRDGIVKQPRPRLLVADEWLVDVRRILNERDAIALLSNRVGSGSIPVLTFSDDEAMAIGMNAASPGSRLWKSELLDGTLDVERSRQAGRLLREIHDATRDDPDVAARFVARPLLDQTRLDPWYRAAAVRHPDLAAVIEYAIDRLLSVRRVLVHGDFVPKNMLVLGPTLLLLDYEVVHYGNPGVDVATFVNHMLLKGFGYPERRAGFSELARAFWGAYSEGLDQDEIELCEHEATLQLGALMLARVDGKSKVEYLVDHAGADGARELGRSLLRSPPGGLAEAIGRFDEMTTRRAVV
jgi:predicted TIM-barrel enzyme